MSVFIVTGESGQYSDHSVWSVKVFLTEESANAYVASCQELADKVYARQRRVLGRLDENVSDYDVSLAQVQAEIVALDDAAKQAADTAELRTLDPAYSDWGHTTYGVDEVPADFTFGGSS